MEKVKLPYYEFEVAGQVKRMRFDFNAVSDLEDRFDMGIAEMMTERRVGFRIIRGLYWAGLKWQDKGLTMERAGNIVQTMIKEEGATFQDLMIPVKEAIERSGLFNKKGNSEGDEQDPNESSPAE